MQLTDTNQPCGLSIFFDYYPTDKWNLYFVTSFYNITEETNFGEGFVEQSRWSNYSELSNNISFLEDNSLNLNVSLTWVGKSLQGLNTVEDRLVSELSISKSVFNKRGVISLSVEDIFNKQDQTVSINYLDQSIRRFTNADNRFVRLGFRYKFGNTKLQTNEKELTEEEEKELERLKASDKN